MNRTLATFLIFFSVSISIAFARIVTNKALFKQSQLRLCLRQCNSVVSTPSNVTTIAWHRVRMFRRRPTTAEAKIRRRRRKKKERYYHLVVLCSSVRQTWIVCRAIMLFSALFLTTPKILSDTFIRRKWISLNFSSSPKKPIISLSISDSETQNAR